VLAKAAPALSLAVSLGVLAVTMVTFEGLVTINERRRVPAAAARENAWVAASDRYDAKVHDSPAGKRTSI